MLFYFTQKRGSDRMTKKQELLKAYEEVKGKALDCIVLDIHMPTGETETIVNPNVEEKIKYIEKTYNDDLVHPSCKQIYIEEYLFVEESQGLDFGFALAALRDGQKMARKGWNGKGMYVYYVPEATYKACTEAATVEFGEEVPYEAYLAIKTVRGTVSTWVPSINDVLAEDWMIVE